MSGYFPVLPYSSGSWISTFTAGQIANNYNNREDFLRHVQTIKGDIEREAWASDGKFLKPLVETINENTMDGFKTIVNTLMTAEENSETGAYHTETALGLSKTSLGKVIRAVVGATGVLLEESKDDITGKIETVRDTVEKIARDFYIKNNDGKIDEEAERTHNYAGKQVYLGINVAEEIEQEQTKKVMQYYVNKKMIDEVIESARLFNLFTRGSVEGKEIERDFVVGSPVNIPARSEVYTQEKFEDSITFAFENLYDVLDKDTLIPASYPKVEATPLASMVNVVLNWLNNNNYNSTSHRLAMEITYTKLINAGTYDYRVNCLFKILSGNSSYNPTITEMPYNYMENYKLGNVAGVSVVTLSYVLSHSVSSALWSASYTTSTSYVSGTAGVGIIDASSAFTGRAFQFIMSFDTMMDFIEKSAKYKKYPNSKQPATNDIAVEYPNWYANKIDTVFVSYEDDNPVISTVPYVPLGINNVDDGYPISVNPSDVISGIPANTVTLPDVEYPPVAVPQNPAIDVPVIEKANDIVDDKVEALDPAVAVDIAVDPTVPFNPTPAIPPLPSTGGAGLATIYNPNSSEMSQIKHALWNEDFLTTITNIFRNNPMDAVISSSIVFATPTVGSIKEKVKFGYYSTGIDSNVVTNQYTTINCGTVTVNEIFNNCLDYEPYCCVGVYLPFIGIHELHANDIIGKQVKIVYKVDVVTGVCVALISTIKNGVEQLLYTYEGNCSVDLPITASSFNIKGMLKSGVEIGAGVASGSIGSIISGAFDLANTVVPSVTGSGKFSGNAGAMIGKKPYLIIKRLKPYNAFNLGGIEGYASNKYVRLGECAGYTRVKSLHLDSIRCTDTERSMIEDALKKGVII